MIKKQFLRLTLLLAGAVLLLPAASHGWQLLPVVQPFVPFKQDAAPRYPAPDFTIYDLDGQRITLSDYKGSVVVMMFWTSW